MELLRFDAVNLRGALEPMDSQRRVAFALACSLRTARDLATVEPLATTARSWAEEFATRGLLDAEATRGLLTELWEAPELDSDDIASSYYALEAALNDSIDSVIWAAQRAYDARDSLAQEALNFSNFTKEVEVQLLRDPGVQEELQNQAIDIKGLQASISNIEAVIQRARCGLTPRSTPDPLRQAP